MDSLQEPLLPKKQDTNSEKDEPFWKSALALFTSSDHANMAEDTEFFGGLHIHDSVSSGQASSYDHQKGSETLLVIEPGELQFQFELNQKISTTLRLINNSSNWVAFKVKITNIKKYAVKPTNGIILPHTAFNVLVIMQALKEVPAGMRCNDKFLIQCVGTNAGATSNEMFEKQSGNHVEEHKLKVSFVLPTNPNASTVAKEAGERSAQTILSVHPQQLEFHFELNKTLTCTIQLTNPTENYVAFKVMTRSPERYWVKPNVGIVMPLSTCDVTVFMKQRKEVPPGMQCEDKFLVRSVIPGPGVIEDIFTNQKMFDKESGSTIQDCRLRVTFVSPPQPAS